jgi:hypothetical protein
MQMTDRGLAETLRRWGREMKSFGQTVMDSDLLIAAADRLASPVSNGPGVLEVGFTPDSREVVLNLPRDMTGHIVFSVDEARQLAAILTKKADEAATR